MVTIFTVESFLMGHTCKIWTVNLIINLQNAHVVNFQPLIRHIFEILIKKKSTIKIFKIMWDPLWKSKPSIIRRGTKAARKWKKYLWSSDVTFVNRHDQECCQTWIALNLNREKSLWKTALYKKIGGIFWIEGLSLV